jgi:hypothetical protein
VRLRPRNSLLAVLAFAVALCGCGGGSSTTQTMPPPPTVALGGSDYGWYQLDSPCIREPYGVVYNYDTATATIDAQLQQMYANGQRRLRIPIYFARGIDSGTIMDSTGGNLSSRFRANLTGLLAAIKATGFEEIEISFNPQSDNLPIQWTTFSSDYFQENWTLIQNLRPSSPRPVFHTISICSTKASLRSRPGDTHRCFSTTRCCGTIM